jgi:hypothetical protein
MRAIFLAGMSVSRKRCAPKSCKNTVSLWMLPSSLGLPMHVSPFCFRWQWDAVTLPDRPTHLTQGGDAVKCGLVENINSGTVSNPFLSFCSRIYHFKTIHFCLSKIGNYSSHAKRWSTFKMSTKKYYSTSQAITFLGFRQFPIGYCDTRCW